MAISTDELDKALAGSLVISDDQREKMLTAITAWVKARTTLLDTDPRLVSLLACLPRLVQSLELDLDGKDGLHLFSESSGTTFQVLKYGSSWLRGGDWQAAVIDSLVCGQK